jgi:hypothetical protein
VAVILALIVLLIPASAVAASGPPVAASVVALPEPLPAEKTTEKPLKP